jgi:hypothetical protein
VKSPVKCVVLTVDFEIFVTNEFWIPIAKSIEKAINFLSKFEIFDLLPINPTTTKIIISKEIGII